MRICKISATNFKGRTFSHDLAPVTVFFGDSFSGKTAALDAVTVALLGHHPELGRRTNDTGDLLGLGDSTVTLELDNGAQIERKYSVKDGKVSDKSDGSIPVTVPVVLLSLRDWFGLTEQQRTQYIFDRAIVSGEATDLAEEIESLKSKYPSSAVKLILEMIEGSINVKDSNDQPIQAWLNSVVAQFTEMSKNAKDTLTHKRGVLAAFEATAALADKSKELDSARNELFALESTLATARKSSPKPDHTEANRLTDLMRQIERDRDAILDESTKRNRDHGKLMSGESCPLCKTEGDVWKKRFQIQHDEVIAGLESRDAKLAEHFVDVAGQLAKEKARIAEVPVADCAKLTQDVAISKSKVAQLAEHQRMVELQKTDKLRRKEAQTACDQAATAAEACKEAKGLAEAFRQRLTDSAFGGFIAVARKLTDGILNAPLEYRDGEIGRTIKGQFVSHRTFSGTEKAITYAGLSVALAQDSPIKLVMIDELGIMDAQTRMTVLLRMVELVRNGVIDQFIGCACDKFNPGDTGIREIEVSRSRTGMKTQDQLRKNNEH